MAHARMKTVFLHFSNYLPWSIFLLLQLLENLVVRGISTFLVVLSLEITSVYMLGKELQ